ncbi:MAG: AMP-binding protein, partial [SAR324 cluster bacterium]|nr:AMP-binding protein [SAR324 cluster bacterium]
MGNGADEILRPGREDRVALLGDWGELTYGALNARVNQWGHGLGERGVGRGDRVVLSLDDDPALVAAYLGAMRLGAVPVAVNPRWSADEMAFALDDSEARCVVTDAASEPTAREAMASLARR